MRLNALQGGSVPEAFNTIPHLKLMNPENNTNPQEQEIHLQLLRYLDTHPQVSQRELSEHLGVSLGKTNYCLRALVDKGLVKARNFKNNRHKRAYLYILTPDGLEAKARITARFLQRKLNEYEALKREIASLRKEVGSDEPGQSGRRGAR